MSRDTLTNFSNNFSERLKQALDGRSQLSVSKRLKYPRSNISRYLNGDLPEQFIFLAKLAKEYSIDLHWLITGEKATSALFDHLSHIDPDSELKCLHLQKVINSRKLTIGLLNECGFDPEYKIKELKKAEKELKKATDEFNILMDSIRAKSKE